MNPNERLAGCLCGGCEDCLRAQGRRRCLCGRWGDEQETDGEYCDECEQGEPEPEDDDS